MERHRFDALARVLAAPTHRRRALLGGVVALAGLGGARLGRPGSAQDAGTPAASPAASPGATPGLLDVVSGTPPASAASGALARSADAGRCCKHFECWERRLQDHRVVERFLGAYRYDPCIWGNLDNFDTGSTPERHCISLGGTDLLCMD